jgi:hypothetical protein
MDTKKIIEALKKLDMPEYRNLDDEDKENGYRQMCQDLKDLAEKDGCSGAAFALSVFSAIASSEETIDSLGNGADEVFHTQFKGEPVTHYFTNHKP